MNSNTEHTSQDFPAKTAVAVLLAAFVVQWTVYPTFTRTNLDQFGDMLENYAWGIGWQWGYFKHPPFFAWTTAAWFKLFPNADWAYYLLSSANAGLAIFAGWRIATRFLDPWRAFLAAALFFFLPPLTFLATKFNANSALLPLWPLAVLFYIRYLERQKLSDAIILGIVAAAAIMTKYFSAVLLAAIALHILIDREARQRLLFRPATWIAIAVFLAAIIPHIFWLAQNDFITVTYAASQGDGSRLVGFISGLRFVGGMVLYTAPVAIIIAIALFRNRKGGQPFINRAGGNIFFRSVQGRALLWASFGSVGLAVIAGTVFGTKMSTVWALPMFYAVPTVLLAFIGTDALETRREVIPSAVVIFCLALFAAIPLVKALEHKKERLYSHVPVALIADAVEAAWAEMTYEPLRYVAGDKVLSSGLSFYGKSQPYAVIENTFEYTPWITADDLKKRGIAAACLESQACCEAELATFPVNFELKEELTVTDKSGREWTVYLRIARPAKS